MRRVPCLVLVWTLVSAAAQAQQTKTQTPPLPAMVSVSVPAAQTMPRLNAPLDVTFDKLDPSADLSKFTLYLNGYAMPELPRSYSGPTASASFCSASRKFRRGRRTRPSRPGPPFSAGRPGTR
jgi:hypothetical protein